MILYCFVSPQEVAISSQKHAVYLPMYAKPKSVYGQTWPGLCRMHCSSKSSKAAHCLQARAGSSCWDVKHSRGSIGFLACRCMEIVNKATQEMRAYDSVSEAGLAAKLLQEPGKGLGSGDTFQT